MTRFSFPRLPDALAQVKLPRIPVTSLQWSDLPLPKLSVPKLNIPSVNIPQVRLPKVAVPNLHNIDLTNVDLARLSPSALLETPAVKQASELAYTAIGFAILGVQKAQVRRREITESLMSRINTAR
ncbi:MAG: hypothetical protein ACO3RB_07265 [Ilumatobacteraceae bacterium]